MRQCAIRASLAGVLFAFGLLFTHNESSFAVVLSDAELSQQWGAGCPNLKCEAKTCATALQQSCGFVYFATCTSITGNACLMHKASNFERCTGTAAPEDKSNCSDTSGNGCIQLLMNSKKADGTCTDVCKTDSGSCGSIFYTCKPITCE